MFQDRDDFGVVMGKDDEKEPGNNLLVRLLKNRTVLVCKPIDRVLMEKFSTALFLLESEDANAEVTVIVNSPGGDADSGFAMYDVMRFVKTPIRSVCAGLCASAGVPVFLGADKGKRFSLPSSRFLLHQPSMQAMGQASDVEITANEIIKIRDKYNKIVEEETGRPAAKVVDDCSRDFWLSASEAVDYGLVNKVVTNRNEIE